MLRQNVMQHFGDYAQAIELDRLDELSASLARQYGRRGDWMFIPAAERRARISTELARLQAVRSVPLPPVAPIAPVAPAALILPAIPDAMHEACADKNDGSRLSMTLRPGETMAGVCEREDGRMVFQLRSYRLDD
ncbi:hypothetical protein ABIB42_001797 [Massilia sp. UYP32]|nr:hypothetical protein [Massilia timonae]